MFIKKIKIKFLIEKIILNFQYFLYYTKIKIFIILFLKKIKILRTKKLKYPLLVHDLRDGHLTFDFIDTLLLANYWLKKMGYEKCDLIIGLFKEDIEVMKYRSYDLVINKEELLERVDNVLLPYARSSNFIKNISLISDKKVFNKIINKGTIIYPPYYFHFEKYNFASRGEPLYTDKLLVENKNDLMPFINFLKPNIDLINFLKKELKISTSDKIATFTIRDYKFEEIRNTNYKFLDELNEFFKNKGIRLILIPDYKNLSPNTNIEVFKDATCEGEKRIAIYHIAQINIGTAGGPVWSARYMKNVNMFVTNFAIEGNHTGSFSDLKKSFGRQFKYGAQPFLEFDMHLIYGPEDNISRLISNKRFNELLELNN